MPVNIDACYQVIKTTKIRHLDYDWVAETALACRNEMAEVCEDDDRVHDLLELAEVLEDLESQLEHLEDWELIANNPDHPEHGEIMAELGMPVVKGAMEEWADKQSPETLAKVDKSISIMKDILKNYMKK